MLTRAQPLPSAALSGVNRTSPEGACSRRRPAIIATIALLGFLPGRAPAQARPQTVCFHPAPGDRCRGFVITEFAVLVGPATGYRRPPANMIWDMGYAHHVDPHRAIGASLTFIADDDDRVLIGVRPRLRQWLGAHTSVDVAPAVLVGHTDAGGLRIVYPGLSAFVGLGWRDLLAVNAQVEVIRLAGVASPQTAWLVGLRLGSYAGLAAAPLGAAFVAYVKSIGDS